MVESLHKFLLPSKLINFEHPDIIQKSTELTAGVNRIEDKAEKVFYFIRDRILYEFQAAFEEEAYLASNILRAGKGFCTQKAILFCALARNCGIPAGIHFYDIVDYTLPEYIVNILRTNALYHHGIVELHLNGNWHRYDATLDTPLCSRRNRIPVEFEPDEDCLMKPKTRDGAKHIEYIRDYGLFEDISFEKIVGWLKQDYPHLF